MPDDGYRFEILSRHHKRSDFACGIEALDQYFRQQVGQDLRRFLNVPYVLTEIATGIVVGYYTLSAFTVVPASLPESQTRRLPHYDSYPAILIGRLAVDKLFQHQGFGELLLLDALRRCLEISQKDAGAMAVVVDVIDDAACSFYESYGFTRVIDDEYRLYLPMATIARLEL